MTQFLELTGWFGAPCLVNLDSIRVVHKADDHIIAIFNNGDESCFKVTYEQFLELLRGTP